ncbi:alpha/beta fold hydrolase [Iodobacter sp.]|uniref:alpha/beta fold hydrolase n=1 Tax=Iodobacter sp. TaxID=1915058 RepID=UPI0025DB6C81|nr:alpha/beta hydrolase [Iodobacter sp.]
MLKYAAYFLFVCVIIKPLHAETAFLSGEPTEISAPAGYPPDWRYHMQDSPFFNGKVFVLQAGQAQQPSVVLVHGLGSRASRDWLTQIPRLARDYHVLAFDLPGFGLSGNNVERLSPAHYGQLINALIEQYTQNGPVILIGHSLGGAISLRYAHDYPDKVRRLVLVDAAGILQRTVYLDYLSKLNFELAESNLPNMLINFATRKVNQLRSSLIETADDVLPDPTPLLKIPSVREQLFKDLHTFNAALSLLDEDFNQTISQTYTPTDIFWGKNDLVAPLRTAYLLAGRMPETRLTLFDTGHVPMVERPEEFAERLQQILTTPIPTKITTVPINSRRVHLCNKTNNLRLSGDYDRIILNDCKQMQLININAKYLEINDSSVWMDNVQISNPEAAMISNRSSITATNSYIKGQPALSIDSSQVDFAGVSINSSSIPIQTRGRSKFYFSVSDQSKGNVQRLLHQRITISAKDYQELLK